MVGMYKFVEIIIWHGPKTKMLCQFYVNTCELIFHYKMIIIQSGWVTDTNGSSVIRFLRFFRAKRVIFGYL